MSSCNEPWTLEVYADDESWGAVSMSDSVWDSEPYTDGDWALAGRCVGIATEGGLFIETEAELILTT